jgi:hypothetical protein
MQLVDPPADGTFTTQELTRLAAYRAAVAAGFYTDWDGSADHTDCEVLAWLPHGESVVDGGDAYPFTQQERQRLEDCRTAFATGGYADDRPTLPAATATSEDA